MQRMIWLRRLALLTCLLLLAAACGNGEETPADDPAPPADEDTEPTDEDPDVTERGDGVLRIGYILPETGPLAFLGPPQIESVQLAIEDINAAGGVLGADVELLTGDEAGDAAVASQSAERLLGEGVDAIVGAAASGMSLAFIDQVVGAEVVQCSASNTADTFTDYEDGGYYFRTAPPDLGQAPVMAEAIVGDGNSNVVILARADDYGQGFADNLVVSLEEQGATVAEQVVYDPEAATFDAEVQQAIAADPDAISLIAFDEGAQILQGLIEAGYGPQDVDIYGGDGVKSGSLWEDVDPNNQAVLEGMKGTAPGASGEFNDRVAERTGGDTLYGGQAYDCTIVIALAAVAAGSDDPTVFVNEMINVTKDGTECDSFESCVELLEQGEDINYSGPSGPIEWDEVGDPAFGSYEVWEIDAEGVPQQIDAVDLDLAELE